MRTKVVTDRQRQIRHRRLLMELASDPENAHVIVKTMDESVELKEKLPMVYHMATKTLRGKS